MSEQALTRRPPEDADHEENLMPRMSFGDHLDELRSRVILALLGLLAGFVLAMFFGQDIQGWLMRPLFVVLKKYDQPLNMLSPAPADGFTNWMQIVFLSGVILSMPWIIYHIWQFVAAGLYRHERRWLRRFTPISIGLFLFGVLFVYMIALPIALNFFVGFNRQFSIPGTHPAAWERLLLGIRPDEPAVAETLDAGQSPLPLLQGDPVHPQPGQSWVNLKSRQYCVQTEQGRLYIRLNSPDDPDVVQNQFAIRSYISFVLMLMLAFGLAFETPIVVVFLAWSGIVSASTMAKSRRYIVFGIVVAAAVLTPPDVLSQVLLAVPMLLLFEGGLAVARLTEKRPIVE